MRCRLGLIATPDQAFAFLPRSGRFQSVTGLSFAPGNPLAVTLQSRNRGGQTVEETAE